LASLSFFASSLANNLHVIGTFDFNNNGKSEILKINGVGAPLEFVELDPSGNHTTIWAYSPERGSVVDAKFADLNNDQISELIVIQKNDVEKGWLSIFEWNGFDFTLKGDPFSNGNGTLDKVRPSNLTYSKGLFSSAISSPTRSAKTFVLDIVDGEYSVTETEILTDPIVTNGYGPVFTGIFENETGPLIALISPESNVLKVGVFSLQTGSSVSDVFTLNGARVVLGPDIQGFDENKDGYSDLIIPFATGEVFTLFTSGDSLSLKESRFSESGLFALKPASGEQRINDVVLQRVEQGLYDKSHLSDSNDEFAFLLPTDSLMLGDTFNVSIAPDSSSTFFEFSWTSQPPIGMFFDPESQTIQWSPEREHIGIVDLSYKLISRTNEEIFSEMSNFGNSYFLRPILKESMGTKIIFVGDTLKPPEPFVVLPKRMHTVTISTKDIDNADRFTFEGETPFSSTTMSANNIITVGVSTDLSAIKDDKSSSFVFQSSDDKPDSLITVSIMHDLSSNIIFTTIKPTVDTLTQSFDAEGQNPDMYQLPEYFFEGFPETMSLEITSDSSVTLLGNVDDRSGVLTIGSPLFAKSHDMTIDYFGGRPYAIRGDVNVKKDGSHKTITEIDFETSFRPLSITTILKSANRDTLVFHADSVPDTLKAKTSYRSFYAPVTIIEKIEDGSTLEAETDTPAEAETQTDEPAQEGETDTPAEESVDQEVGGPDTPAEAETQTDEPAQEAEDPAVSTTEQDSNITENPSPEDPLDQIENLPAEAQPDSTGS
tara:strand:+ start:1163 stop:3475 length:2313 start_codon:yes stop_codon:yes gene_type:complete